MVWSADYLTRLWRLGKICRSNNKNKKKVFNQIKNGGQVVRQNRTQRLTQGIWVNQTCNLRPRHLDFIVVMKYELSTLRTWRHWCCSFLSPGCSILFLENLINCFRCVWWTLQEGRATGTGLSTSGLSTAEIYPPIGQFLPNSLQVYRTTRKKSILRLCGLVSRSSDTILEKMHNMYRG